jgi:hypothetical protein
MNRSHSTNDNPRSGYAAYTNTNAPEWHWLVVWDILLNNLAIGLFLVAATADLVRPDLFQRICAVAYPIALLLLLADLLCLVLDLGDPLRFHHMLRVFKPSSPMSLGTWSLTAFSLPLTAVVLLEIATWTGILPATTPWLRMGHLSIVVAAIIPAFLSAAYKGVLFSTNAQPGWRDARAFGAYLMNSAIMLGSGQMLALSTVMGETRASTIAHTSLMLLIGLNLIPFLLLFLELKPALARAYDGKHIRIGLGTLVGTGFVFPLVLLIATHNFIITSIALLSLLLASFGIRAILVFLPHHVVHS